MIGSCVASPTRRRSEVSERVVPQHCPYCGETTLFPQEEGWECRSCLRAFAVSYQGMIRPTGGTT